MVYPQPQSRQLYCYCQPRPFASGCFALQSLPHILVEQAEVDFPNTCPICSASGRDLVRLTGRQRAGEAELPRCCSSQICTPFMRLPDAWQAEMCAPSREGPHCHVGQACGVAATMYGGASESLLRSLHLTPVATFSREAHSHRCQATTVAP